MNNYCEKSQWNNEHCCERQCEFCRNKKNEESTGRFQVIVLLVLLIFILSLIMFSCSPQRRIERIIDNNPSFVKTDTVFSTVEKHIPGVYADTVFSNTVDTVFLEKEKLRIKYRMMPMTKEVFISGECLPDTVTITVPTEVKSISVTKEENVKQFLILFSGFVFILLCLAGASLKIIQTIKNKKE